MSQYPIKSLFHWFAAQCIVIAALILAAPAWSQNLLPGERSTVYYKIGGGEPLSHAANPGSLSQKLGLGGVARLNYSCGKFDSELGIAHLMNNFAATGTAVTNAVKAGIAALPMYVFQRAAPGLYELFQTYRKRAEAELAAALKSCEEMEAVIREGSDPYEDWIKMAKGEGWKVQVNTNGDVVDAKVKVEKNAGKEGVTWVGGIKKGGFAQAPVEIIRDLVQAGYNATMNLPPNSSPTKVFPTTGAGATKLTQAFASPKLAGDWAVDVMGDRVIATCDEVGCPAKAARPGMGLLPKFEAERPSAETQLSAILSGNSVPNRADLEAASAPGVAITRELVEALRDLRPLEREIARGRLAMEVAQARVIDKALLVRNVLLTGSGIPEGTYEAAQKDVRSKVEELNRYIDDLLFETRVRREVVSTTANVVIETYRASNAQSSSSAAQGRVDKDSLDSGRVK